MLIVFALDVRTFWPGGGVSFRFRGFQVSQGKFPTFCDFPNDDLGKMH